MNNTNNLISVVELRRLLYTLVDNRLEICFRYRLLGEMWQPKFLRVVQLTPRGVLLSDEATYSLICLDDLAHIMQFELDVAVHHFLPHNHYDVNFCENSNLVS